MIGESVSADITLEERATLRVRVSSKTGGQCDTPWARARRGLEPWTPRSAALDERGRIVVPIDPSGKLEIEAGCPGLSTANTEVFLAGDTEVELTLDEGSLIAGQVVDAEGTPVTAARVLLRDPKRKSPTIKVMSASDGSFEAWTWPGDVQASAKAGHVTSETMGVTSPTEDLQIALPINAPDRASITGVVGAGDKAPQGIKVVVYEATSPAGSTAQVGEGGRYAFESLEPGRYFVGLSSSGLERREPGQAPKGTKSIDLAAGQRAVVDFPNPRTERESFEGTVVDDGSAPVPDAQISAYVDGVYTPWKTLAGAGGAFVLEDLPGPVERLTVVAPDGREISVSKPTSGIEVALDAVFEVCGTVTPPKAPMAVSLDGREIYVNDPNGAWCAPGVRPGEHVVEARAGGLRGSSTVSVKGDVDGVSVELEAPGGPISGTCPEVAGGRVLAYSDGGHLTSTSTIDPRGLFVLKSVPAGSIALIFMKPGDRPDRPHATTTVLVEPEQASTATCSDVGPS